MEAEEVRGVFEKWSVKEWLRTQLRGEAKETGDEDESCFRLERWDWGIKWLESGRKGGCEEKNEGWHLVSDLEPCLVRGGGAGGGEGWELTNWSVWGSGNWGLEFRKKSIHTHICELSKFDTVVVNDIFLGLSRKQWVEKICIKFFTLHFWARNTV